ncbi:MAG: Mov34/MPN/PAD-1 family protein [Actinobacteria bacterium]|nr:Mov34/MPN/PAD-1 family protein [Actinomycetota bacterium]
MGPPLLTTDSPELSEITLLGQRRAPVEACGVFLPTPHNGSCVVELPNRTLVPNEFAIWSTDILEQLKPWLASATPDQMCAMVIWHVHPGGGIGPSRTDLQSKVKGAFHLVVALTDDGPVPTYY